MVTSQSARDRPYQKLNFSTSRTAGWVATPAWISAGTGSPRAIASIKDERRGVAFGSRGRFSVVSPGFFAITWIRIDLTVPTSEMTAHESPAQPGPHEDRAQVQHDDDRDEQHGRGEDHRLRGLAVRALKPEIV